MKREFNEAIEVIE